MDDDEVSDLHNVETIIGELSITSGYPPWRLPDRRKTADAWELLWHDLKTKAQRINNKEKRLYYLTRGLLQRLVADDLVPAEMLDAHVRRFVEDAKPSYDAIIFTVLQSEFQSACIALGVEPNGVSDAEANIPYVHREAQVEVPGRGEPLSLCIVQCDKQRNVPMVVCCRTMLEAKKTPLCVLLGIAAGNQRSVALGDVVVAQSVLDYEGGSIPPKTIFSWKQRRPDNRPTTFNVTMRTSASLANFRPENLRWLENRARLLNELAEHGAAIPAEVRSKTPSYKTGTICSGEKVRRDGYVEDLAQGDTQIHALDMEASGFASACRSKNLDWVVCRGISDMGDSNKNDDWHPAASLHAALAVRAYLSFLRQSRAG